MLATKTSGLSSTATLVRFALLALVPLVALGAVLAYELNVDVQQRYLDTAKSSATLIAQVGIQPLLNQEQVAAGGLGAGDANQMDIWLQGALLSDQLRRIKVWNRNGTIVYSDNHALIGRTFRIDDDLGAALAGTPKANITDGHDEENTGDNLKGPLVQVYVPLVFLGSSRPSGAFELYLPYAPVQAAINSESQRLYGLLAAGLSFFYVSMLLVVYIAERWRRRLVHQAEATALANMVVLERLNRVKSEFLTRISHQFRTALVGIEGFTEVIRDSENLDLDEVKAFANDIHGDAERLDRAFNDMVELDRMEAGRAILDMHRADVNQLISRAVEAASNQDGDHVVTTDLDPAAPAVTCDREKIAQVLSILLGNAIRYSAAGTQVVVASRTNGEDVEISVKDHGPGMPLDFDDGLFVGYQKQGSDKSNGAKMQTGAGTGLGLPIARQIVELHGGRMWFDSKAEQGTEFHFTLPMKVRSSREMAAVARP